MGKDGQQNLTAGSPVRTDLLPQSHSTGLSLLPFPSTPQIPTSWSFKTAKLFSQKPSETQGTAKQQSHHPPSKELNEHKLSSAPKSSKQTEFSQPLSSSVVWSPGHAGLTTSLTVTNQQDHTVNSTISPPAQDPGFKLCVCCGCIRLKCTRFLKKQKEKKPQKI